MTTDQKHPEGGGPGDSPVERLLREALAARADQVGVHDLRPAAPPSRRIRRLKPVHAALVPLGLAAAVTIGFAGFRSSTVADRAKPAPAGSITASRSAAPTPSPSGSPAPSPSASTSASASTSTSPDAAGGSPGAPLSDQSTATTTPPPGDAPAAPVSLGAVQSFRGVNFRLPSGWSVSVGSPLGDQACLEAPDPNATIGLGACGPNGITLAVYTTTQEVNQAVDPTLDELDRSQAWSHQPYCYDPQNPHNGDVSLASYDKSTVTLPAGQAGLATWNVNCTGGGQFTARMWGFQQQVLLAVRGLDPKYESGLQAVLGSLDLSGHLPPMPNPVSISTSGLGQGGQQVPDDNTKVPFSVTFTNTGSTPLLQVLPDVTVPGAGAGTLEEQADDGSWVSVGLAPGAPGPKGNVPAFQLAAGAAKTVNYRISFAPAANFAQSPLNLVAVAWLKFVPEGSLSTLGTSFVHLPLVTK
ncbi:hypothetical protein E6W39_22505 [Kitasatospora acidiphila]|uniref:Uncharacterized protein n=1 Tax=Kitasatospora acidiphila TaxID=2567942 RepID=A0A540W688_9ACTN|nr:hypothetical protein [Kitasatospora acidiphila]TQF04493.1 hypothetical protein E6W39_22505 [Kitasatospora acidiphila]